MMDTTGCEQLLFHRIRPVFVFDGGTPELKRRTVQHRRVLRERQEHNLRKAAEKILVAQLKQAALATKVRTQHIAGRFAGICLFSEPGACASVCTVGSSRKRAQCQQ